MKIKTLLSTIVCWALLSCAATQITGYSDPAYTSASYTNTVVFATNLGLDAASQLEGSICAELTAEEIQCFEFHKLFPPTRHFSVDDVFSALKEQSIQSLLVLSAGGDYSSNEVFGYQAYGSASTYGGQTTATSTAVPLRSYSRQSDMRLTLVDAATRETAWLGDAKTEGQGMVNVTDGAFISSIAGETANALAQSPHF